MLLATDLKEKGYKHASQTKGHYLTNKKTTSGRTSFPPFSLGAGGEWAGCSEIKAQKGSLEEVSRVPGGREVLLLPRNNCGQSPRGIMGSLSGRTTGHLVYIQMCHSRKQGHVRK